MVREKPKNMMIPKELELPNTELVGYISNAVEDKRGPSKQRAQRMKKTSTRVRVNILLNSCKS